MRRGRLDAMAATLVLPQSLFEELAAGADGPLEAAGVLIASLVRGEDGGVRLLGRKIRWIDTGAYERRDADGLSISSHGYVPALAMAEGLHAVPIWLHTHPGIAGIPVASVHDQHVDRQIADLFRMRSGSSFYAALILSPRVGGLSFTGHLEGEDGSTLRMEHMWMVGDRLRLIRAFDSKSPALAQAFDRNVRAFGSDIQQALGSLRIGIVGCGGTGSAVAEQAVRLGIRHFTLVDPDVLSESNLTRVFGSTPPDVTSPKVDVVARNLSRIAPTVQIRAIRSTVVAERTARQLSDCDLVFGCTDDNAGRLVLSRLATYLMTPVIDCGVLISSDETGRLIGVDGRVTVLVPGQACLVCRGRIDVARASAEMLTGEERKKREDEGYAPALGATEPAVVTFTAAIAAAALSELLERMIGYGPEPRPSEVLIRWHERAISTNVAAPRNGHYCHPASEKLGSGNMDPFLDQLWLF